MHGGEFNYNNSNIYITRSGYTGEDGFEISISNKISNKLLKIIIKELFNKYYKMGNYVCKKCYLPRDSQNLR